MEEIMFHILFFSIFIVLISTFCILKYVVFKNNEKFNKIVEKLLKIFTVVYCALVIFNIFLPDGFTISLDKEILLGGMHQGYAILRWLMCLPFVALPIAVFSKNRQFKNIAIYFCVIVTLVSVAFYSKHMQFFTSADGRGLNSVSVFSKGFKQFLLNGTFRGIFFGFLTMLELCIPIMFAIQEKHVFNFKSKADWLSFLILPFVIISSVPIYVPQYLFGYSNIVFETFGLIHWLWVVCTIILLVSLYFIFRKKGEKVKKVLLFVLSLCLVYQYTQMFGAVSISLKRLPLQLCNLGAYLILFSLITMNRKIFNFTMIINVVGVIFALAMPDLDGEGLFYLYNLHFILEHTNVLIIPVLMLLFGVFPRLDKFALRDCLIGFTVYFISVWALGTAFNAISNATGNGFYSANYMFMFSSETASEILPFTKALFDLNFKIGYAVFYPIIQILVYIVFSIVCVALYFAIKFLYYLKDKVVHKQSKKALS